MRLHRFLVGPETQLKKEFWLRDESLIWQWNRVLRYTAGQEVVLFDGVKNDRLYSISRIDKSGAYLQMITQLERKLPTKDVCLFWSLLKKDSNEHILQKCTEIGVSKFIPIISTRTIKKDFNYERAKKIVKEASEQCGRSDIPSVREPLHLETALKEYAGQLYFLVCQQGGGKSQKFEFKKYGVFIGPEGGWTKDEQKMFSKNKTQSIHLGDFVLRAETAAVVAAYQVLQSQADTINI